jgi:hypothetical protein
MSVDDFSSEAEQRAWDAQERALRDQPFGLALVQALRAPPLASIPADFAAVTATLAEGTRTDDDRLERWLQVASVLLGAVAAVAVLAVAGSQLGRAITLVVPAAAIDPLANWGVAIMACAVVSLGLDRWTRRWSQASKPASASACR